MGAVLHKISFRVFSTMVDTHIAVAVIFDVPDGEDYKSYFPKFYSKVKAGTKDCLYYGFATCGNKVLCREGYKNGAAMLAHTADVKEDLESMIKKIGKERVKIICSGPAAELDVVKPKMDGRLPIKFVDLDSVLYFSTLSQKAALIPTSPFFQSLLSQQGKWTNSRLDSPNSTPLLKMVQEQVELFTMVLVLLVTVFTAEKDLRMPRLLQSTEQISSPSLKNQLRPLELVI